MKPTARRRLSCTVSTQVAEAITQLEWSGLYGRTRADVIARLVSEAIESKIIRGIVRRPVALEDNVSIAGQKP